MSLADRQAYQEMYKTLNPVGFDGENWVDLFADSGAKMFSFTTKQLRETGAWLKINGEGIYATHPREGEYWKEGDKIRFTKAKDNRTVYAFSFDWPGSQLILIS